MVCWCCCKWHNLIIFYGWVIFIYIYVCVYIYIYIHTMNTYFCFWFACNMAPWPTNWSSQIPWKYLWYFRLVPLHTVDYWFLSRLLEETWNYFISLCQTPLPFCLFYRKWQFLFIWYLHRISVFKLRNALGIIMNLWKTN